MINTCTYESPLGNMLLAADDVGLRGLWFEGQKYFASTLNDECVPRKNEILKSTRRWLDMYFSGLKPKFTPKLHMIGSEFRQVVWRILLQIPYGEVTTYGAVAEEVAKTLNVPEMSAQAVGGAVGHNAISIIIPCHRIVGANGSLTGYSGVVDKKLELLRLEQINIEALALY